MDNALVSSDSLGASLKRPRAFETILYGGMTVGILDGLAAVISAGLRSGLGPIRVFQYIASGLLGLSRGDPRLRQRQGDEGIPHGALSGRFHHRL
jgi:hypothetical protein